MRAVIRHFISPDADLQRFFPSDPLDTGIFVQMLIGTTEGDGEESFNLFVCTPQYLTHWHEGPGPIIGRHNLIVQAWDWAEISAFLTDAVESEEADTWEELGERLGRLGHWEFEDYLPWVPPEVHP